MHLTVPSLPSLKSCVVITSSNAGSLNILKTIISLGKKKERSVRDRRIQQRETREKRNWNGHWCWDTAENSSQAPEKGQKNKAVFPLLCTPDLPCHQKQLMALFINSHKPHLFFSLVKILKYRFLPVSESQLRADSYRPSPWNYQNGCCQVMANVISTYLLYCI